MFLVSKATPVDKLKEVYCKSTNREPKKTWFSTDGVNMFTTLATVQEGGVIWVHDGDRSPEDQNKTEKLATSESAGLEA